MCTTTDSFYAMFSALKTDEHILFDNEDQKAELEYLKTKISLKTEVQLQSVKISVHVPESLYTEEPVFINFYIANKIQIMNNIYKQSSLYINYKPLKSLVIYENGNIYEMKNNKCYPATVKNIVYLFYKYKKMSLLDKILTIPSIKESYIFKDLIRDCVQTIEKEQSFPSILWNNCIGYKNRNQLMKALYKNAEGIDFNKISVQAGCLQNSCSSVRI